jgi:hypothetical protein
MVEQEEVDVVEAEPAQAAVEAGECLLVAVVADPKPRRDEHDAAVDSGAADAFADLALVAVDGGGVDEPVAVRDRRLDGADGFRGWTLEDAQSERGHLDAVAQGDQRR